MGEESLSPNGLPTEYILIANVTVFPLRYGAMYIQSTEFTLKFQYHENEIECINIYEASGIISCDSSKSLNVKI